MPLAVMAAGAGLRPRSCVRPLSHSERSEESKTSIHGRTHPRAQLTPGRWRRTARPGKKAYGSQRHSPRSAAIAPSIAPTILWPRRLNPSALMT